MNKSEHKDKLYEVNNMGMYLDEIDSLGLSTGVGFELAETNIVKRLINRGDAVFDIGANIGYYTLLFSRLVGESGEVIAFEPEPINYSILSRNVHFNKCSNVTLFNQGLSDTNEKSTLYTCSENAGMHRAYPSILCDDQVQIELIKIDSHSVLKKKNIDFVKIDIEGFELKALKGMVCILKYNDQIKVLTEFSPAAIIECGYNPLDYIEFLIGLGFHLYSVDNLYEPIDLELLKNDLQKISKVTSSLIEKYSGHSSEGVSIATISNEAQVEVSKLGYDRPLYENFLCLKEKDHMIQKLSQILFPLNVYALVIFYETNQFGELHYGLFCDEGDNMLQAQNNHTQLIFEHLSHCNKKLLEVGIGLGNTHQKLIDNGFDCTGITPDKKQIAVAKQKITEADLICVKFEDFELTEENARFNIVLFQESAQYIDPQHLFSKAKTLLASRGRILILDEFSTGGELLHNVESFKIISRLHGFKLIEERNLSEHAAPTIEFLLAGLEKYGENIANRIELASANLANLVGSLMTYQRNYKNGQFVYMFFVFEKI